MTKISTEKQEPAPHTLGAHPDKSGWFQRTRIHTILSEPLSILSTTILPIRFRYQASERI